MVLRAKRWNNVIHHVSAEKILDHRCVCGALPDLGLDVSGNSLRHPLDPAILDGRYAVFFGRRYNVWRGALARCAETHARNVAKLAHHRRMSAAMRKRRGNRVGKMGSNRSCLLVGGDGADRHRAAWLDFGNSTASDANGLARPRRRFYWGRRLGGPGIRKFIRFAA